VIDLRASALLRGAPSRGAKLRDRRGVFRFITRDLDQRNLVVLSVAALQPSQGRERI
jgi:hypothetical protein